ncbi:chemotaxis protein [Rhizobiales bacterium]|uniref:DUF6468 domain-containing protein n=1 Tax=Hongsoonwoonella zoysiae TaxID=2821844 RepID=UPI00155FDB68|nr:DUF6468 domain-containing protein [Hongsoonwoonella zoysiae]NRG18021.1 chemotaxis protein [Hongsoonwoonella zoysiae]
MSDLPIGILIESLVAGLLLVTIGYCWTLNRRLKRLRADEESLRATISELITASEIAERAIVGLKTTAGDTDRTLGNRLNQADRLSRQLAEQIEAGGIVLERISQIASAASKPAGDPVPAPAEVPAVAPRSASTVSVRNLRDAASEAAARLEQFRKRNGEKAA